MRAETGHVTERGTENGALATDEEAARALRFSNDMRAKGRRSATIGAYESDWRVVATWSSEVNGEPFDLTRLVAREVAEFRSACLRLGQAPATVNRRLAFLTEYSRWAAGAREIRESLAEEVAAVPRVRQQPLGPRGLTKPALRHFLKEVDLRASLRDKAIVYLLLYTGIRLGEAASLRPDDLTISERKGSIRIRSESAKGGKERAVPVALAARKALAAYLGTKKGRDGPLFEGERGPLGRGGIARVVAKYADEARVEATPHTLRHCFAYRYPERTANDLVGLAAILGHSNLNTTMGYTRRRMEDLEAALEGMEFA